MFQGKTDAKCSGLRRDKMITSRIPRVLRNVVKTPIPQSQGPGWGALAIWSMSAPSLGNTLNPAMQEPYLQTPDGNRVTPETVPVDTASSRTSHRQAGPAGQGARAAGPWLLDTAWQDPSLGTASHQRGAMGEALMGPITWGLMLSDYKR